MEKAILEATHREELRKNKVKKLRSAGLIPCVIYGNGKDIPSFTYDFINKLKDGYDYIQGSRYLKKGMFALYIRQYILENVRNRCQYDINVLTFVTECCPVL